MHPFHRGKIYGTTTMGARGQVVIPADLRKELDLKSGDKLMVIGRKGRRSIGLIPAGEFSRFLREASRYISEMEKQVPEPNGKEK